MQDLLRRLILSLARDGIGETMLYRRMIELTHNDTVFSKLGGMCPDELYEGIAVCVGQGEIIELKYEPPGSSTIKRLYFERGTLLTVPALAMES